MSASTRPMLALVLALAGCAAKGHTTAPTLPDANGLATPFLARQRVIATAGAERHAFDAVLQYDGSELLLLGLTPMGTKAFVVRQRGTVARAETFIDRPLPAPPEAILLDVHWSYFLAADTSRTDGWHRRTLHGLRVRERWQAGRVRERIIAPRGAAAVRIEYKGGLVEGRFPDEVVVVHEDPRRGNRGNRRDLRLEITTLSHDPIAATR